MEMLRTIIVALVFAGITVCTYYYLNSSQFPWEIMNSGENVAQTSENPAGNTALNNSGQTTFAPDGPFAPASAGEDDFSLPAMNELPQALEPDSVPEVSQNVPAANPMVMTSETQPPVLDTDLPALNNGTNTPPAPVQANHEKQIGSYADLDTTQALPAPEEAPSLDLPPAPSIETTPGTDLSVPTPIQAAPAPVPNMNPSGGNVTNPLRTNSTPAVSTPTVQTMVVPPSPAPAPAAPTYSAPVPPAPAPAAPVLEETPVSPVAPTVVQSAPQTPPPAQMSQEEEMETAAIREYLKKANEKIQNGEALEVLRQLSKFYGNPRFSAEESSELVDILVQAASQVIYSQKSFLDPPYTVQPGDTVEKIAEEYEIPKDFIILVNGLQPGAPLQPGTQLKVIHGPFHALVYLDRFEMLLTLNGLFAGRFWIGIGGELIQKDSDFSFAGKSVKQDGALSLPCCDFRLTAGETGCADTMQIQGCANPNVIGGVAPNGKILMSQTDVQSLNAILGSKSQLILRCHSSKPAAQQTASGTDSAAPASVPAPAPAPAYGSSAELPNTLPNTLPDSLPGTAPAPAAAPAAEELPLELPATL